MKSDSNPKTCECEWPILVALAAGEMTEGQASILLDMDYIDVRSKIVEAVREAKQAWEQYRKMNTGEK